MRIERKQVFALVHNLIGEISLLLSHNIWFICIGKKRFDSVRFKQLDVHRPSELLEIKWSYGNSCIQINSLIERLELWSQVHQTVKITAETVTQVRVLFQRYLNSDKT